MKEINETEELIEKELSISKIYRFPFKIVTHKIDNKILVIQPESCNWLVLDSEGYDVFKLLQDGNNIEKVIEIKNEETVIPVITQIEAKKFDEIKTVKESKRNIYIYLTNNCNLRCNHCYMFSGDIKIEELPLDVWKKIILDFKNSGGDGITFTGGEILVYGSFREIIKYTHELGISTTVLTNGLLWNEKLILELTNYIDEVQISIDGFDRQSYMSVRGIDGFEKTLDTVKLFSKGNTKVSVAITPMYENLDVFVNNFKLFGNSFIKDNPSVFIKINMELLKGRNVNIDEEKNRHYKEKMKQLTECLYPDYFKKNFILNFKDKKIIKNCGFGEITLASNGDIYWCNRIFELKSYGNIKDYSFSDLFKLSSIIREKTDVNHSIICSNCDIKYICGGGCRLKYPNINNLEKNDIVWNNKCNLEQKDLFYRQMIESNDYFFE